MEQLVHRLFPQLKGQWAEINFNEEAKSLLGEKPLAGTANPLLDPDFCADQIQQLHRKYKAKYSYGGYLEDRAILWHGHYHKKGMTTHLGVDFNVPANTKVVMPCDATLLQASIDPDQNGGWGGKLIFKRQAKQYFILGHLRNIAWEEDRVYKAGEVIGTVAESFCNGGWYPHLHVQCTTSFLPGMDGYGRKSDGRRCPNPMVLLA